MTDYQADADAVVRKTYQEHALGNAPWGTGKYECSYEAGCAIGLSVSPELAAKMDSGGIGNLFFLLRDYQPLQLELFGVFGSPPRAVIHQLVKLQDLHDNFARSPNFPNERDARDAYKNAIELNFPDIDLKA